MAEHHSFWIRSPHRLLVRGLAPAVICLHSFVGCGLLTGDAFDVTLVSDSGAADGGADATDTGSDSATSTEDAHPSGPIRSVQGASKDTLGAASTKIACAFGNQVKIGNTVVVAFQTNSTVTAVSGGANTFEFAGSAGSATTLAVYYATITSPLTDQTVTVEFATPAEAVMVVHEYSGIDANQPLDQSNGSVGTGTEVSSGDVTTTFPRELIFGFGRANSGLSSSPGAGFAARESAAGNLSEDLIATTTGTFDATFTANSSSDWAAVVATFRGVP